MPKLQVPNPKLQTIPNDQNLKSKTWWTRKKSKDRHSRERGSPEPIDNTGLPLSREWHKGTGKNFLRRHQNLTLKTFLKQPKGLIFLSSLSCREPDQFLAWFAENRQINCRRLFVPILLFLCMLGKVKVAGE